MKIKLAALFCLFTTAVFSQGVSNLWVMGYESWAGPPWGGINMDFAGGTLSISYQSRKMNFGETNGVICDKNGKLLFYTNGVYVANADDSMMVNGDSLNLSAYTTSAKYGLALIQGNVIIPFPDDTTKYYLFHETIDDYGYTFCSLHLYYSVIDMKADNGRGAVIQKNVSLLNDSLVDGYLTSCKHANGRDWWLIAHQNNTNKYYKFLITPIGISALYMQNIGGRRQSDVAQCVFSPDGGLFAYYDPHVSDLDIFNFDRCTGNFTLNAHVAINDSAAAVGVAFSPNSKVLYVSSMTYVYQFDMTAANITASQLTVAVWDSTYSPQKPLAALFYLAQLAPDGKIYINCPNSTDVMHVINNPDVVGVGCDFCQHCVHIPALNGATIANHPNYFLGALKGSLCDTVLTGLTPGPSPKERGETAALWFWPNPVNSSGEVTFTYASTAEVKEVSIYNTEGRKVAHYGLPQWSSVQHVRLPRLAGGVYLARLQSGSEAGSVKFVVE